MARIYKHIFQEEIEEETFLENNNFEKELLDYLLDYENGETIKLNKIFEKFNDHKKEYIIGTLISLGKKGHIQEEIILNDEKEAIELEWHVYDKGEIKND